MTTIDDLLRRFPDGWTIKTLENGQNYKGEWIWACIPINKNTGSLGMMGAGDTPVAALQDCFRINHWKVMK